MYVPSSKKKSKGPRLVLWAGRANYTHGKDCRDKVSIGRCRRGDVEVKSPKL